MTAIELAVQAKKAKPHVRYAYSEKLGFIAAFDTALNRFVIVAGRLLTGEWASLPFELLVNGEPVVTQDQWKEV